MTSIAYQHSQYTLIEKKKSLRPQGAEIFSFKLTSNLPPGEKRVREPNPLLKAPAAGVAVVAVVAVLLGAVLSTI